jgi:hypothetical protein
MVIAEWNMDIVRSGVFGDCVVYGIRYIGPNGEAGWHTASNQNANPTHHFWVIGSEFHGISGHIRDPQFANHNSFVIGEIVEDVDPAERQALLEAIELWEKRQQDIQSVIEEETQRVAANSSHAFDGRPNDPTIGSDGERKGVQRPENPEGRFE